uniref:BZIP_Maf domain-containing protein n=1 Tax=Strongyloides papillosus TaxID=174720 RepID=A0A0N5B1Z0_STREA
MYTSDNHKYNNGNIFSKHLPFLKDKFFLKSQLPFIEINNNQPIRINALVIDNNFDPDVVFGSKKRELYKKGFSTTGDENSQNTPSNSLEISNNRKSPSPDIDINFKHQYDKSDQANFGRKSPFSDTQSLDDYIDEALNNGDFDIDKFACNDKDMCDNLFSSLDEVERNQHQSFDQFPRENEQFLTSEFEIIAREMENDPLDPLSSHFDPYMYDMKMTPKKIDIPKGYDRRKGQSSSESQSLFGSKKILTNRVVRKESSVPVDIPGDMSLRPELAKGINYYQYRRPSSTDNELYGNELSNGRKKSGRVSKDKELLIENRISITPSELRDFSLKEFKLFLDNNGLSEEQKILCRNIRRRGRNKIAAKKVRTNRYSRSKNSDDSTSETFSISPTLFLNDPEPTPPRFVKKSQGFTYPDFEFSDDIFENTDPLYEIRDVQE